MKPLRPGARVTNDRLARRQAYADYIASGRWHARKHAWLSDEHTALAGLPLLCGCGCGTGVGIADDFHHRTYDRLGNEDHTDIVVLVHDHHMALHRAIENSPLWRTVPLAVATDALLARSRARHLADGPALPHPGLP